MTDGKKKYLTCETTDNRKGGKKDTCRRRHRRGVRHPAIRAEKKKNKG